ncbi:MAG: PEGA domain-containing protein, partial [Myxococcota bacterium]
IEVDQPGARIFIDGAIVGLSPFTQEKALSAGSHQIQVELPGYNRYSASFDVARDEKKPVVVNLDKYDPGVSDGTLSDWGRNLIIFGLIGGGLGFGGPIVYQEFILDKPYFTQLGPENGAGRPFYDGTEASLRSNEELDTLETVQLVSLIAGGTLVASGLVVYMFKWFRSSPPPPPVTAGADRPSLEITGFGVAPTFDGAGGTVGITGRF